MASLLSFRAVLQNCIFEEKSAYLHKIIWDKSGIGSTFFLL